MLSKVFIVIVSATICSFWLPNSSAHLKDGENHEHNSTIQTRFFYGKRIPLPGIVRPPTTATSCATANTCCARQCIAATPGTCPNPPSATTACTGATPPGPPTACMRAVPQCPECATMAQTLCTTTTPCAATGTALCNWS